MDIEELRKQPHLSVSGINDYIDCGLLYKFRRVDRVQAESKSLALKFGSVTHKVLADFYQMRMIGENATLEQLQVAFELYLREAFARRSDIDHQDGKGFLALLDEGKDLLRAYYENLPMDQFKILAIEEPFRFVIDGLSVPMVGVFDLVEEDESGTIIITDWKTSNRSYSKEEVAKNFQLTVYHIATQMNGYANREILLKFDCLIKTQKPRFEQFYTTRSAKDQRRAFKKIQYVFEGISKGVFIPNDGSWKCKGCGYRRTCREWHEK